MSFFRQVFVSRHAIERWCERVAVYSNEDYQHVIDAFNSSRKCEKDEVIPGGRQRGSAYYYNKEHDCFFVVDPWENAAQIVTIIKNDRIVLAAPMEVEEIVPVVLSTDEMTERMMDLMDERTDLKRELTALQQSGRDSHLVKDKKKIEVRLSEIGTEIKKLSREGKINRSKLACIWDKRRKGIPLVPPPPSDEQKELQEQKNKVLEDLRQAHAWNEKEAILSLTEKLKGIKDQLKELNREKAS